jgi:large subunit ribosomal protein L4
MPKLDVYNLKHEKVGDIDLSDEVFAAEVKEHLLHEVVVAQLASNRAGTHAAKNRASCAAPPRSSTEGHRSARHGDINAPIFVGAAARIRQRRTSATARRAGARRSAEERAQPAGQRRSLTVLEDIELGEMKTKKLAGVFDVFEAPAKTLVVDDKGNENLKLSIRNMKLRRFLPPEGVNVYDLLRHDHLIVSRGAAKALEALPGERK